MSLYSTLGRPSGRALDAVACLLLAGTLSCSRATRDAPAPGEIVEPQLPPPASVRTLPEWVEHPSLHPALPSTHVIGAVGRSRLSPVDADNAALDALVDAVLARVGAARRRVESLHPYFAFRAEFVKALEQRLQAASPAVAELLSAAHVDSASRIVHDDISYTFAYIDRRTASETLRSRSAHLAFEVDEAVDIAMSAAEIDNWFGFVRWSRSALFREADRVTHLVLRDALGEPVPLDAFDRMRRLDWIGVAADTLRVSHGFTLHAEFEWEELPPRQMEPRITRHLMNVLLGHGLKAGLGEGCPSLEARPLVPWPPIVLASAGGDSTSVESSEALNGDGEDDPDGEVEAIPAPHHVLRIRSRGSATRTALASWDAIVELTIEARTCESGTMVAQQLLGTLEGRAGRDSHSAYHKALDWARFDEELERRLREIGLLPPLELVDAAPGLYDTGRSLTAPRAAE